MTKHVIEIGVRLDWKVQRRHQTPETQSVEDNSIEAAESDGTNEGEELQERNLTEEALIVQTETSKINNVAQYITMSNITDCNNLLCAATLVVSEWLIGRGKDKSREEISILEKKD